MSEVVVEKKKKREQVMLVNPFIKYTSRPITSEPYKSYRIKTMEIDKETLTAKPVFEEYDIQAEIEARKDDAGFNAMRTLIMQGRATPEDFQDDGKHGFDNTLLPQNIHEAKKIADAQANGLGALAKALGIKEGQAVTAEILEKYLGDYIKDLWNKEEAAKKAKAESEVK